MIPEFSRSYRLDELGGGARKVEISADAAERTALADRFDLIAIETLEVAADLVRDGEAVTVTGHLRAAVTQACVASGEPVPAEVNEPFALRFVPAHAPDDSEEEMELAEGDLDEVTYDGNAVDLGEAAAQTLALALDPFPRAPDADETLREAGVVDEEDIGPFAALKALKDKLGKD